MDVTIFLPKDTWLAPVEITDILETSIGAIAQVSKGDESTLKVTFEGRIPADKAFEIIRDCLMICRIRSGKIQIEGKEFPFGA